MMAGSGAREPQAGGSQAGLDGDALARVADEQAALRRVAKLVTQGAAPAEIFAAVAREVGELLRADVVHLARYEHDGVIVALAAWAREGETLPVGSSAPYRGRNISAEVLGTGRPVRVDDFAEGFGAAAERVRSLGLRAGVGAPILIDGRVWGVVVATSKTGPFPPGTEERIAGFTELAATALSNAASQDQWRRVTHEPAALERVATLVARAVPAKELMPAVAAEIGMLLRPDSVAVVRYEDGGEVTPLGAWPAPGDAPAAGERWQTREGDIWTTVFQYRAAALAGSPPDAGREPPRAPFAAGCPIVVEGDIWGAVALHAAEPLPLDAGSRLSSFAELIAAAVANERARTEARRLADEQAALRRVAMLVARAASAGEVFDGIAHEMRTLLNVEDVRLGRYDGDALEVVAMSGPYVHVMPIGTRLPLTKGLSERVRRTGRPQRLDGAAVDSDAAAAAQGRGYQTIVAVPLVVDAALWGVLIAGAREAPFERGIEGRLADYAELMGMAVANLQARESLERVLGEQAALRRVATLVARGTAPAEVFSTVAREVGEALGADAAHLGRFDDGTVVSVGQWGPSPGVPIGSRFPLDGDNISARVLASGQSTRMEGYEDAPGVIAATVREIGIRSAIGVPISMEGRPWGVMIVSLKGTDAFPAGTELRLRDFTELVATAISNATALTRVHVLADEQAALRRVATLVAGGAPPSDVFDAVAGELGRLLDVGSTGLVRFENGELATVVAAWGRLSEVAPVGVRLPLGGTNVVSQVARTGRAARVDDFATVATGVIAQQAHRLATRASVGAPVVVAGKLWGAMVAAALEGGSLPPDTEARVEQFAELIATAVANTDARVELARLADEQAALRRVATLVAEEAPAPELLARVAEEVAGVLGDAIDCAILRYEPSEMATVVAVWGKQPGGGIEVDARLPVDGSGVTARVYRERRPVRVDDYDADATGAIAQHAQQHAIRCAVGCPIVVHGRLWGAMVVAHHGEEPFLPDTERRIQQFTDLVATAIANAEARAEQRRLADQQAALRRVATLVAQAATPTEVFDAVIVEVAQLLGAAQVGMMRYDSVRHATIVAQRGQDPAVVRVGMEVPLSGESVTTRVGRTGRSARVNHYDEGSGKINELALQTGVWATVGAPITVEGRTWGVITASWEPGHLPPGDAEARVAEFAALIDTAIANADSRGQLETSRARVLTAGDEARRRVVRDLHDGAQQRLVHTLISLQLARRAVREDADGAEKLLDDALDHAEQANVALRELAHGILPSVLTRGGLRAAVDSLVGRLDIPVEVDITGTRLPPDIEANAYFIVAEGLTNVVKHAEASRAEVRATIEAGTLRVEVRDDGIGGADPRGHGLLGIGDRAGALGGRMRVVSPPRGGTVVTAELPLGEAATGAGAATARRPR
jgi:GAF domain-containing protein